MVISHKALNGTAPIYLNALAKAYVTTRSLRSSKDCRLAVATPRSRQSRHFSGVVPRWWNDLPSATRTGASLSIFKETRNLKIQLFREHLLPQHLPRTSLPPLLHFLFLYFRLCLHSISTLSPLTESDQWFPSMQLIVSFDVSCNVISSFVSRFGEKCRLNA